MTKEELREHCEKQVKTCEMWAKHRGIEPSGKIYEEHKLILDLIKALEQQPCEDAISRQAVLDLAVDYGTNSATFLIPVCSVKNLPPVTPTHGTCKDCKHWKDSDGVYRRGMGAESKCPINNSRVFEGTFYCADFEKRGSEND